ncbi:hypothetical protein ACFOG5_24060 [Pedobacter fastidiosus]|uniref:hypothetical protein n=1 Tax=Pedobacter fastidiosus TaxID=2765361 RepID=UPI00360FF53E
MNTTYKYIVVILLIIFITFFLVKGVFQSLNDEVNGMPIWFVTYFYDAKIVLLPLSYITVFVLLLWFASNRMK